MNWERIDDYTERAKVFGGWLVKVTEEVCHYTTHGEYTNGYDWRPALAFVPDPRHKWKLEKKPEDKKDA